MSESSGLFSRLPPIPQPKAETPPPPAFKRVMTNATEVVPGPAPLTGDARMRILAVAASDAASAVQVLTLQMTQQPTEHSRVQLGHARLTLERVLDRIDWVLTGKSAMLQGDKASG